MITLVMLPLINCLLDARDRAWLIPFTTLDDLFTGLYGALCGAVYELSAQYLHTQSYEF
jgi:hypothetical protein